MADTIIHKYPSADIPLQPVGIGLRHPYHEEILETDLEIGWIEVHPENYFGGGAPRHFLSKAREQYQLSLHAVGLSLGSSHPVKTEHLQQFKHLIEEFDPFRISDHASWSASGNAHLNDLLPLPYTKESLNNLCRNVERTQDYFGRQIWVENPSSYVAFHNDDMSEPEFMNTLADRTGCGILLDINNIFVQSFNHGYDAFDYIDKINKNHVGEMHLAGHTEKEVTGGTILIDTHNRPIKEDVWRIYAHAIGRFGAIPTLIEWDQDFPSLADLVAEADTARQIINKHCGSSHEHEALKAKDTNEPIEAPRQIPVQT